MKACPICERRRTDTSVYEREMALLRAEIEATRQRVKVLEILMEFQKK